LIPFNGIPFCQMVQCAENILFRITVAEHSVKKTFLIGSLTSGGPAENGGIPDAADVFPIRKQRIQGGGIGKSSILTYRRIGALFVFVGTESRGIKGNQRGTTALCADHTLDVGMQPGQWPLLTGDKAANRFSIDVGGFVIL